MNTEKKIQPSHASFFDQDDLRWLVGGVLFHTGLISAHMLLYVLGMYVFPNRVVSYYRAVKFLSISSLVCLYLQGSSYYQAVSQAHTYPLLITLFIAGIWYVCWLLWSVIYIHLRKEDKSYFLASLWIVLSVYLFEHVGIGFTQVGPMLVQTYWETSIYWLEECSTFLFVWLCHLLRQPILRHGIWFIPLLLSHMMPPLEMNQRPGWLDEVHIFPEGTDMPYDNYHHAVYGKRVYRDNQVYFVSMGKGDVQGISTKRHFVKVIEDGYSPYNHSRILHYKGHPFLVLVCYDAMFSDYKNEAVSSELIVITSSLSGLKKSPVKRYFLRLVEYAHLKYNKPVYFVDTDIEMVFPKSH